MATFLVRPSQSEKEAFRIKLTGASMLGLKLMSGDVCMLSRETEDDRNTVFDLGPAIAWEASGSMKDNVMQTSKLLQDLYGFKLGDKLSIKRSEVLVENAQTVKITTKHGNNALTDKQVSFWEYYAELSIKGVHEYVAQGQTLSLKAATESQQFEIVEVCAHNAKIAKVTDQTYFQIVKNDHNSNRERITIASDKIGGLKGEIAAIQSLIDAVLRTNSENFLRPVQGALIYGVKGAGKTHLIEEIAKARWKSVIEWEPGVKVSPPKQATLIVVDDLYMPSAQSDEKRVLKELNQLFKTIQGTPCLVLGEAQHPNDIHSKLRKDSRFAKEIEIPIPSAPQRKEILSAIWPNTATTNTWAIDQLAERTHGYVAMDLFAVCRCVIDLAQERISPLLSNSNPPTSETPSYNITPTDISTALTQIRPSALQEIFLETPTTTWSDIGGQHAIKRQLQNAVERPLKQATQMATLNLPPKKGLLMYGPPGCSKTLLVRALAREAGLNFLAVKGAELISMYVGESERAVREIFRKARNARPSIVFFDEIDSIAGRGRGVGVGGSELNVLTTLLNEMDGFEELRGVFVVAATNKPEVIDGALLRPGRFDNVVYVGLPDGEARREILMRQFESSNYRWREGGSLGVDVEYWAERMEGFSGAEVVGIRFTACEISLEEGDLSRDWYGFEHMEKALKVTPKGISKAMLDGFERWNAARAS